MKGQVTANIKFQDFAEQWFEEYAKLNLRNTSYERMKQLTVRVYPAIGHLRLDKITSRHIQQFINDLALNGKSLKTANRCRERQPFIISASSAMCSATL